MTFGDHVRALRIAKGISLRELSRRAGIESSYLSKIERGAYDTKPPGEQRILDLARELEEDPDVLLAMAGKMSADLHAIVLSNPQAFASLLRQLKGAPERTIKHVEHVAREVKDGEW